MEYLYGSGLLFAAFLLLFVCRMIFNRPGANRDPEAYGVAEAVAIVVTTMAVFGGAAIAMKAINDWSLTSTIEMVVTLAVLVAASVSARRALARVFSPMEAEASENPGDPSAPFRNRRGRSTDSGNPTPVGGSRVKRAA